jgi:glycosyltransferase involved in cell wall biosynthesis
MKMKKQSSKDLSPHKRVLIVFDNFHHYRLDLCEHLGRKLDLTIVHASRLHTNRDAAFREISIPARRFWKFRYQPGLLSLVRKGDFDAVIYMFDVAWLSTALAFLLTPRKAKRITWGFWLTKSETANKIRTWFARRADENVFYSTSAAKDFRSLGIPARKLWVARNSVRVELDARPPQDHRKNVLFLGSFNDRKRNDVAVKAFDNICDKLPSDIRFVLVGDGPAKTNVMALAKSLKNSGRFLFKDGTIDANEIQELYSNAIVSVSFGQAGLSVLQSLGYGVPFVSSRGAISGGEIENIHDGVTGIQCEPTEAALSETFLKFCTDPLFAEQIGQSAYQYYKNRCTIEKMASGFLDAIEGTASNLIEKSEISQ